MCKTTTSKKIVKKDIIEKKYYLKPLRNKNLSMSQKKNHF